MSKAILDFKGEQNLLSSNSKDCIATRIVLVEKKICLMDSNPPRARLMPCTSEPHFFLLWKDPPRIRIILPLAICFVLLGKSTQVLLLFALPLVNLGKGTKHSHQLTIGQFKYTSNFLFDLPLENVGRASQGNQEFPMTHSWLCCENFASHGNLSMMFIGIGAQWEPIPMGITNWRGFGETLSFTQSPQIIFHLNPLVLWSTQKNEGFCGDILGLSKPKSAW
jgi:hypothetical protein